MQTRIQRKRLQVKKRKRFIAFCGLISFILVLVLYVGARAVMDRHPAAPVVASQPEKELPRPSSGPKKDKPTSSPEVKVSTSKENSPVELLFSFAGDNTLGGHYSSTNSKNQEDPFTRVWKSHDQDFSFFYRYVRSIFKKDDATIVNLEGTLTRSNNRAIKRFTFKGDPSFTQILKQGNIEMVNLANNHTRDFGDQGLLDTIENLTDDHISYFGEGHIAYATYKNIRVAFMGYKGWDLAQKEIIGKDLQKARKQADIVIVTFHWGDEKSPFPNAVQTELGRFAIDQGASLIIGHHPHVLQGIEIYKGRYIVYSLGNFSFGGNTAPRDRDTMIFQNRFIVDTETKTIRGSKATIIPCYISSAVGFNNFQPIPVKGKEKERIFRRLAEASRIFKKGISLEDME